MGKFAPKLCKRAQYCVSIANKGLRLQVGPKSKNANRRDVGVLRAMRGITYEVRYIKFKLLSRKKRVSVPVSDNE